MLQNRYLNSLDLHETAEGNERRYELLNDLITNGTFLPKTVLYKDIDEDFKRWVDEELVIISDEGKKFPTMSLYSNQRFSEYAQSWEYTDKDNNILLNFKTVTRNNNPELGSIVDKTYNIPGERFYLMKRKLVLDDNGTESLLDLRMKLPVAIDFTYKLSIFTTKYQLINEFNLMVNDKFKSRQCYIRPNEHYMPMHLESISDESQYQIDDRQFYSQSYTIKVLGYTIKESDYKVEERPLKYGINVGFEASSKRKAEVEIDECDTNNPYYYKPITLTINFPDCINDTKFTIDTDFKSENIQLSNILNNYKIFINDEIVENRDLITFKENDEVKIKIARRYKDRDATMILSGYNPNAVYDENKDNPESVLDITQTEDFYDINQE